MTEVPPLREPEPMRFYCGACGGTPGPISWHCNQCGGHHAIHEHAFRVCPVGKPAPAPEPVSRWVCADCDGQVERDELGDFWCPAGGSFVYVRKNRRGAA